MNKKIKVYILSAFFGVILLSSTIAFSIPKTNIASKPDQQNKIQNLTKFVEDAFLSIPFDCYVIYANPDQLNDTSKIVYTYKSMNAKFNAKNEKSLGNYQNFYRLAEAKLYMFNHCKFFDNRNQSVPVEFNPILGTAPIKGIDRELQIAVARERLLAKYDFAEYARSENNIGNIATFFMMSYDDVVRRMFDLGIINLGTDCKKAGFTPNSTVYDCSWHDSHFGYDKESGSTFVFPNIPSLTTKTT